MTNTPEKAPSSRAVIVGATIAAGVAVGALAIGASGLGGGDSGAPAGGHVPELHAPERLSGKSFDPEQYAKIVDSLSELVNLEVAERRRLEAKVQALGEELADLQKALEEGDTKPSAAQVRAAKEERERLAARERRLDDGSNLQKFIDAGFSPERAEYLKQKQDALALDRLFLRDEARRDGWTNTQRYREALNELNNRHQSLRQELGDEDYDRYLYAIGRPNRVVTRSVLSGGPAEQAGLQPGDAIISYDGQRVFDSRSLVDLTSDGSFGTTTPIEVERGGERLLLYIPRGPLGVNMSVRNIRPD